MCYNYIQCFLEYMISPYITFGGEIIFSVPSYTSRSYSSALNILS